MIGLDTNVLVRFLVSDDPGQSREAARLIAGARERGEPLFLNGIVLCELVWVLTSFYRFPKEAISDALEKILLAKQFEVEDKHIVWRALGDYKASRADFADCLVAARNTDSGCSETYTFDRDASTLGHYRLLKTRPVEQSGGE